MNYDLEFLDSVGITCEPEPDKDDRRARAIFWRILVLLIVCVDVAVIQLIRWIW